MAHPFRYFRKHQKAFLAVAAVVAMFVFVIGDAILGSIGQDAGPDPNKVVASWNGGRLTSLELETLVQRRHFVSQFLQNLMVTGASRLLEEGGNPMPPQMPDFIIREGTSSNEVAINVVSTRILANEARKMGITISDDVINHYLREISFRRVSNSEIVALLQRMRGGDVRGLEEQLFAGLRELLLGNAYVTTYSGNIRSILPEQKWEDWLRINERISLEVATLPVDAFINEVPDPEEPELRAFYEEHKDDVGHQIQYVQGTELPSATPGFKQPRRVRLNYLLGDVAAWSEKFKDSITEEEIADYYERNKRTQFVKSGDTPAFDASLFQEEPEEPADENPLSEPANSVDESGSQPAQPEAATQESPESADSSAADIDSGTEADESQSPEVSEQSIETSAEVPVSGDEQPAPPVDQINGESTPTDDAAPTEDQSRHGLPSSIFRFAAFQVNDDPASAVTEAGGQPPAEPEDAGGPEPQTEPTEDTDTTEQSPDAPAAEAAAVDAPAVDAGTAQDIADQPAVGSETDVLEEATDTDATQTENTGTEANLTEEEVEFEPLDSVRDVIRDRLATDKAVVELRTVMERIYGELHSIYNPYGFEVVSARSEKNQLPTPPETLTNLKQRAAEHGLVSEETILLTQRELVDTMVGKAVDIQTRSRPVALQAFDDLELYEPMLAQDLDGNYFLVTKAEDVPEKVPAFDEIREQVVRAWKEREAAKLALQQAEELAEAAEKSGDNLRTFFIGKPYDVRTTDMFSWLTFGTTPTELQSGPKLGDAPPLDAVGPDFMESAFTLENNMVAAILNHDHTSAYVFQVYRREASPDELREIFLREGNDWYGGTVMQFQRWRAQEALVIQEILERVDFDEDQLEDFLKISEAE